VWLSMSRPSERVESSHPRRELLGAPDWEETTDFARLRDSMTAVGDRRAFVSCGQDIAGFHRQAATYVDKILKGARSCQSQDRQGSRAHHSADAPATRRSPHRVVSGWLGGLLVGLLVAGILLGCSVSPAQQDAIRRAWEARDAERSRECERVGRGFVAGGCTGGGGP